LEEFVKLPQYPIPNRLKKCFEICVKQPYDNHPKTDAWLKEIVNKEPKYHRDVILERGTCNFNLPFNGLDSSDKVFLYCYQYMQMHVMSNYHVFYKHRDLFSKYIDCDISPSSYKDFPSSLFVDFGCGPLSAGLGFVHSCIDANNSNDSMNFYYIGIDSAKPMLDKAKEICKSRCFGTSSFKFLESDDKLLTTMEGYISQHPQLLIILNFSYFFASVSLDVHKLVRLVKEIINKYESNQIYVAFQNPQGYSLNQKWNKFREALPMLQSVLENGSLEEIIEYEYTMRGSNDMKDIKLYYDILQNIPISC
jgi:hypothetical protein